MDTSGGGAPALAQSWHSRGVVLAAKKLRPEPALSLALLRVVVALMFLLAPGFAAGVQVAAWDPARFVVPEGLHWFVAIVPIRVDFARVAQGAVLFFAVLGALGVYARAAFTGLTLSGFYLFAIAQLTGFVWHDMHLLWFSAVLAISPCADVLAYDAEHPWDHEHERYALPLLVVRLLFGVIYFFPGFRKLYVSGTAWVFSDNLHNQLYWKWLQHGEVPAFRIDQIPYALQAGGAFVIAFELGFVFLVLFRRVRPWLAICGVLFHLMTEAIFRIPFASLWLCYVALVDLRPVLRPGVRMLTALRKAPAPNEPEEHADSDAKSASSSAPSATMPDRDLPAWLRIGVATLLLTFATLQGARGQMHSYPFACYPTFEWRAASSMPDLGIAAVLPNGTTREVPHARTSSGYRTQRQWAELWSLAGVYGPAPTARIRAYLKTALRNPRARRAIQGAVALRLYRDSLSVLPEDHDKPPKKRRQLLEISLRD